MAEENPLINSNAEFEQLAADAADADSSSYVLSLYVSGMTPRSTEAINNLRQICEQHLSGRYELQIIDIYKHPELAGQEQVIATPTLVKRLPAPIRRLVGTLSDEERVLVGLDLAKRRKYDG
jgi:circadian clock protein KaiB